jgi:carotenoid cleavage oxygenase
MSHEPLLPDRRAFLVGAGAVLLGACTTTTSATTDTTTAGTDAPAGSAPTTSTAPAAPATAVTAVAPTLRRTTGPTLLAGNFAPTGESTAFDLRVSGTLPNELRGRFFRQGPNPLSPGERYSWFAGDGMVHVVELGGGTCRSYRSRMVRTDAVAAATGTPTVDGPPLLITDLSNTAVIAHAGMLLSTTEASLPYAIDADGTTLRREDLGGGLTHGLSAHPQLDPRTGELHQITYSVVAPVLVWQVIDASGAVTKSVPIDVPAPTMAHTMSLTERHVVVYDLPVELDAAMIADGWGLPYRWNAARQARVGVITRDGSAPLRWFDIDPCFVFHEAGAHDVPGGIELHAITYDRVFDAERASPVEAASRLERWRIDLTVGRVVREVIDDRLQEFPRTNPAVGLGGARYLYTTGSWTSAGGAGAAAPYADLGNEVIKHDLVSGTSEAMSFGPWRSTAEAVFVADPGRSVEDGGWLLSFVYDAESDTSVLAVVDAQDVTAGPVATVHLGVRVPMGFHGTWVPD